MPASLFRRLLVVLGLVLFAAPAAAQSGSITGRVIAADSRPIADYMTPNPEALRLD